MKFINSIFETILALFFFILAFSQFRIFRVITLIIFTIILLIEMARFNVLNVKKFDEIKVRKIHDYFLDKYSISTDIMLEYTPKTMSKIYPEVVGKAYVNNNKNTGYIQIDINKSNLFQYFVRTFKDMSTIYRILCGIKFIENNNPNIEEFDPMTETLGNLKVLFSKEFD